MGVCSRGHRPGRIGVRVGPVARANHAGSGGGRVLIVDNYDSYTYNLAQLVAGVEAERPLVVRNDDVNYEDIALAVRRGEVSSVVISPGPGTPAAAADVGVCAPLLRHGTEIPVLGVCLGHQALAYTYGAAVKRAVEPFHGRTSKLVDCRGELFRDLPRTSEEMLVVRYHSLEVDAATIPSCLSVDAWAEEEGTMPGAGHRTVMSLSHVEYPHYGVQFHPESIATIDGSCLFSNFADITRKYWQGRRGRATGTLTTGNRISLLERHAREIVVRKKSEAPHDTSSSSSSSSSGGGGGESKLTVQYVKVEGALEELNGSSELFWDIISAEDPSCSFWLDSSSQDTDLETSLESAPARFSYMGSRGGNMWERISFKLDALDVNNEETSGAFEIEKASGEVKNERGIFFDYLQDRLRQIQESVRNTSSMDLPFDFLGGFVGYLSYELKYECDGSKSHASKIPDAVFYIADRVLVVDHKDDSVYLVTVARDADCQASRAWMELMETRIRNLCKSSGNPLPSERTRLPLNGQCETKEATPGAPFVSRHNRHEYLSSITDCQDSILDGDSYELCLTNELTLEAEVSPRAYYSALRRVNPSPYSAYFAGGNWGPTICCSSPERFLKLDRDGTLEAKPIKGTVRRGRNEEEDKVAISKLHSVKEHAENLMIVDLLRNDLGRVCEDGSIHVPHLMAIESYATVHQLVSTVRGTKRPELSAVDCVRAAFPGGSMTGAPKIRSMAILDSLEKGPRGVYSGAMGFFSINGTMDLNIVIRTAVFHEDTITVGAGGAVTYISTPEGEYEEMLLKAEPMLITATKAMGGAKTTKADIDARRKMLTLRNVTEIH